MFCYPIDKIIYKLFNKVINFTYRQDVGILFRSVKFLVPLTSSYSYI